MKIYPYLIDEKRMVGYYNLLLEDKFNLRLFDKKKDKEIYKYFMPAIRDYLFWTFNLNTKDMIEEYKKLGNDLRAAICDRYYCNVFEKGKDIVICFSTGVCFAVTEDKNLLKKLTKYEDAQEMEYINLRSENEYDLKDGKEEHLYAYVLELYKLIYMNKINKYLQDSNLFDKTRNGFVDFSQKVYAVEETDKDDFCNTLRKNLKLDELYITVENQFDLLYKNGRLNENLTYKRFAIILLIVFIIIGIIILFNQLDF